MIKRILITFFLFIHLPLFAGYSDQNLANDVQQITTDLVYQLIEKQDRYLNTRQADKVPLLLSNDFNLRFVDKNGETFSYDRVEFSKMMLFANTIQNYERSRSSAKVEIISNNEAIYESNLTEVLSKNGKRETTTSHEVYELIFLSGKIYIQKITAYLKDVKLD